MPEQAKIQNVLVTGATGFVGRSVVRELLRRGLTPVCLVRSARKLTDQHPDVLPDRLAPVIGTLGDEGALRRAAEVSQAAIHLVGIIIQRRVQAKTFAGIHVRGTQRVIAAMEHAGIQRLVHMSALGTSPNATSPYHKTKWKAEQLVTAGDLDWTIFRPSLIHGPEGEFMQLLHRFICGYLPPVIPYFGSGRAKLQPVSVKDVAYCMVESLFRSETIGQTYALGGPKVYSWRELYDTARYLMPKAKRFKPMAPLPVGLAKAIAILSAPPMAAAESIVPSLGMFRFDAGQVSMSQEDAVCNHKAAEQAFSITMRSFEDELRAYADQIP